MPWLDPSSVPFTRLQIASQVPSDSGVYGIADGDCCIFIGESWNLKARLLELASVLSDVDHLTIWYELCPEDARGARKAALTSELLGDQPEGSLALNGAPGISFWGQIDR